MWEWLSNVWLWCLIAFSIGFVFGVVSTFYYVCDAYRRELTKNRRIDGTTGTKPERLDKPDNDADWWKDGRRPPWENEEWKHILDIFKI